MCFASVSFFKNGFYLLFNRLRVKKRNEMDGKILWLAECCALRPRMGKSQEVPWRAAPVLLESPSQCGLQREARRLPLYDRQKLYVCQLVALVLLLFVQVCAKKMHQLIELVQAGKGIKRNSPILLKRIASRCTHCQQQN
jgi:hypothetical protein